ncbi:hypothetical protein H4R18_002849 [Coemansia javaensis]|uniref:Uncharacterized protein n=1 Tax=Coemansia javaensis TaxID=2761396 RepID=A0A9W8LJF8_9FUNG|nr:hypothetical protein H4R18_002849 [Coemansia javaensis]
MDASSDMAGRAGGALGRAASTGDILRLSTGTVQCAYSELKREALSELFDHCMTPLASPRARPLSAAFFGLDILGPAPPAAAGVAAGLPPSPPADTRPASCSPCTYTTTADPCFAQPRSAVAANDDGGDDDDNQQPPARGTFADLRRKLYGGVAHAVATADCA